MMITNNRPFDNNHFIGYVKQVTPEYVMAHIPASRLLSLYHYGGERHHPGIVGTFIAIEGEEFGFVGRILELSLSENERLNLTERSFEKEEFHPVAKIEILISFNYFEKGQINKGLDTFPHIGAKVFSCTAVFLQQYLLQFGKSSLATSSIEFNLGVLASDQTVSVTVEPQSLFGRHCAVVGTTGGGKSWTVAKLVEEVLVNKGKAILLDATGEYRTFVATGAQSVIIGENSYLHYSQLGISDLFYLLRPSDKVQRPKLMEAIRSLKMVKLNGGASITMHTGGPAIKVEDGLLKKEGCDKLTLNRYYHKNIGQIETDDLDFDIKKLPLQIVKECIWDTDRNNSSIYGGLNESDLSFCTSLISRLNNLVNTSNFQSVFGFDKPIADATDLIGIIEAFLSDPKAHILRISLEEIGYDFQVREILANAIGRCLLKKARTGQFKTSKSLIVFIDEAHQFMNKTVQDEYSPVQQLDAFELIAKESRKFGLFLCLATQMPRDIPQGTLSQMGTFIVHRLINRHDKDAIENACSSANRAVLSFLPTLGRGEAILLGVDFPMPIAIRLNAPDLPPDSTTPPVISA